ncbi:MAG: hypothetical protein UU47_C0009G0024 [candidate division TM6 bacterium GW2011_GWE2_41_16]|nr:MAG: hypothetical protein UU47_C0009G0024 [candidate division TM6 bacterium GW2011_GWE2_41_16]
MFETYLKDIRYAAALSICATLCCMPFLFMPLSIQYFAKHYQTISKPLILDLNHMHSHEQPAIQQPSVTEPQLPPQAAVQSQPVPEPQALIPTPQAQQQKLPKKRAIKIVEVPSQVTVDKTKNAPSSQETPSIGKESGIENKEHGTSLSNEQGAQTEDSHTFGENNFDINGTEQMNNGIGRIRHQTGPVPQQSYTTSRAHRNRWFSQSAQQNIEQQEQKKTTQSNTQKAFAKAATHTRYQQLTLTKIGSQQGLISQDLSGLPDHITEASAAELQIFVEKVNYTLARYLDEHNFFVYAAVRTDAPINFELIAQNGRILAYVVVRSSNNVEFDRALGKVIEDMGNDLIAPISTQPIAFPFTYTVHFEPGLLRYHISRANFFGE